MGKKKRKRGSVVVIKNNDFNLEERVIMLARKMGLRLLLVLLSVFLGILYLYLLDFSRFSFISLEIIIALSVFIAAFHLFYYKRIGKKVDYFNYSVILIVLIAFMFILPNVSPTHYDNWPEIELILQGLEEYNIEEAVYFSSFKKVESDKVKSKFENENGFKIGEVQGNTVKIISWEGGNFNVFRDQYAQETFLNILITITDRRKVFGTIEYPEFEKSRNKNGKIIIKADISNFKEF